MLAGYRSDSVWKPLWLPSG